jgi:multiple sugar transport system substrate-binding protein
MRRHHRQNHQAPGDVTVRRARLWLSILGVLSLTVAACAPAPPAAKPAGSAAPTSAGQSAAQPVAASQPTAKVESKSAAASQPAASSQASSSAYLPPLPTDRQITIRFENYNLASAGLGRDATLKMIADFEARFPNVKVETKATGAQEIFPSVQAQLVAGDPPDLAQLLLREWDLNVEFLQPQDLRQIVAPDELNAHLNGQYPLHPRGLKLTERNGKLQGLAYVFSTPTLFYNAELFKKAGLDPAKPPRTWAEVKAAGEAVKQQAGAEGLYIQCIEQDWCTQGIIRSNDGRIMNEERTRIMFGEPATVEVFSFWQSMVQSGAHAKMTEKESTEAFQAGKLAMLLTTSANQANLLKAAEGKFEVKATGMPSFGDKPAVPVNSGSSVAILAKDPIKQRAAWELMKHLTGEQAFTIITAEIGYLPLRTGIVQDERYLKSWKYLPLIQTNLEQMERLEPSYSYPGQNHLQIRKLFLTAVEEVLMNGKDAKATFGEAQTRAQDLMPK